MATTINSGYANSPKLTANIADHADVYGGRALVFDGVADYLDCGDITSLNSASAFSISVWIKSDNTNSLDYLYNKAVSGSNRIHISIAYNIIYFNVTNGSASYGTIAFTSTDWNHISLVFNGSGTGNSNRLKAYINGEEQSLTYSGTIPSTTGNLSGTAFQIGKYLTDHFDGSMCDFKIFDSALTEAQVQELYKKPENTPSAVQDNLVAWYPMIEGNPESPQSIVYDHSEKGKLGTNIVKSPLLLDYSHTQGGNTEELLADGTIKISRPLSGGDPYGTWFYFLTSSNHVLETTPVVGQLYKLSFNGYYDGGGSQPYWYLYGQSSGDISFAITTTPTDYVAYFIGSGLTGRFQLNTPTAGQSGYIKDLQIKPVLMGNHAQTNFFGDELITNGDFDSNASSWLTNNGAVLSSESGGQSGNYLKVLTASINNPEAKQAFTVEPNKQYRYSFYHKDVNSSSDTPQYAVYNISGSSFITNYTNVSSSISSSSWVLQEHTFTTPSGCTSVQINLRHTGTANDNSYFGFDTVSVKEVGISSSGFETAVNEPVVPQVPLMRYNQKMYFDGGDDYVQLPAPLSSTNHTISAWYIANSGDKYILDARDNGADGIALGLLANGTIWYAVRGSGSNSVSSSSGSFNVLNHVVATYNGSTAKIYLNGVEVGSGTFTETISTTTNARIGKISYANSGYFDGVVHEVAFFNKDFTQTEVQELFNDGVALDATTHSKKGNLLGYWRNDGVTTWQDRRGWSALTFDSTDYIDCGTAIGNSLGDSYSNDLTLSVWFKLASTGTTAGIFQIGDFAGAYGAINLFYSSAGALYFRLNGTAWTRTAAFSDLGWNHVVVIYDANSQSNSELYLNGVSVSSGTAGVSGVFPSSLDFNGKKTILGSILSASHPYNWEGDIKSIGLYNVVKSQSEIEAIYNAGINSSEASNSGIINYWELNNASTVKDFVGSSDGTINGTLVLNDGNDGSVQGSPDSITIREGLNSNRDGLGFYFTNPSNNVLRLNGVDEYVQIPDNKVFSFGNEAGDLPFSIEAWIKPTDVTSFTIISKGKYNVDGEYLFEIDANDDLYFSVSDGAGYEGAYTNSALTSYEGSWLHVCGTYDGRGGTDARNGIKLYINGVEQAKSVIGGNSYVAMHNKTGEVEIGKYDNNYANGLIDELRIYNKELSLAEIQKNYKHQKGKHKND